MPELGIALALGCALATNLAMLCKHRGAVAAPDVELRRPLRSVAGLFRSRWWAIGFAIAFGAWILHVAALAMAPLSTVETVISGGLVMLAYLAQRLFGLRVGPREWLGLGLCATGLALLGLTGAEAAAAAHRYSTSAMVSFEAGAVGIGALLLLSGSIPSARNVHGVALGVAAGLLFGVANVAIKGLTMTFNDTLLSLVSPWTLVALMAGAGAFFALARGLQRGDAIPVIALSSVGANCASVLGGVLVFGDSVGEDPISIIARCTAFIAVLASAAMMRAPARAAATAA
jgi:drug/metabolite transporter (DMT)-like permease